MSLCQALEILVLSFLLPVQSAELGGALTLVPPGSVVDLSAEGQLDWAHWGLDATNIFNHKNGVSPQITNFTIIGTNTFGLYTNNLIGFSWTDGVPVASITNTTSVVAMTGLENGFAITFPADTRPRRLKVYCGVADAQGEFQASLSDASAPDYTDNSLDSAGDTLNGIYTLHYAASSSNQVLTVRFIGKTFYDQGLGNITLEAATLATNQLPAVVITSPTNNAFFFVTQNINLNAVASDGDGTVTNVEFFQGTVSLGQTSSPPYTITWSNAAAGNYTVTGRATDNEGGTTTSAPIIVRVSSNLPPTVAITSPVDEAQFFAPATITITVDAWDTNGTVSKVEFFQGATKLGERTNAPYSLTWTGVGAGFYSLTAKATDNEGATTVSSPIKIFVTTTGGALSGSAAPVPTSSEVDLTLEGLADWAHWGRFTERSFDHKAGVLPQISTYSLIGHEPAYQYGDNFNGYTWTDGTPTLSATNTPTGIYVVGRQNGFQITAPADATPKTLKVYVGAYAAQGKLLAYLSDLSAPLYTDTSLDNFGNGPAQVYTLNYSAASPGQTLVTSFTVANMHDSFGNVTLQAATLTTDNNPPIVTITTPTNHSIFLAPVNLNMEASASDNDGSVALVEFFDGATRLAQIAGAPYRFVWTTAPLGSHSLTAKATDNRGATFTCNPVEVFVTRGGGLLLGSLATPPSQVDLSQEGRIDWAHDGYSTRPKKPFDFNHRRLVTQRITNFAVIGPNAVAAYGDNAVAFSWTNGTPDLSVAGTTTGVYVTGETNGFRITVPADTDQRRLKVYLGLFAAQGRFEASLSDASAASYVDTALGNYYNNAYGLYTLDFAAAASNQVLAIKYTASIAYDPQFGNVTLQAATLALPSFSLRNLIGNAGSFRFSFLSEPGMPFTVLYSDQLEANNWLTLTSFSGSGAETFVTNYGPLPPQRSFRVRSP